MKKIDRHMIEKCFYSLLIFSITCFVVVAIYNKGGDDYVWHFDLASEFSLDGFLQYYIGCTYPLWHISAKIVSSILPFSDAVSAGLTTATFSLASFIVAIKWMQKECMPKEKVSLVSLMTFLLFVLGPLYVPQFNVRYYLGQGTPNTWHNPTNLAVRPFAILAFILIVKLIRDYKKSTDFNKKELLALSITLAISVLAKPSCIIMLVPGLGLYMIITILKDKKLLNLYVRIIFAFVPAVILLFAQYLIIFASGQRGNSIGIGWCDVLHLYTSNIFVSMLLALAFPLYIFIVDYKESLRDVSVGLALCCLVSGWLEAVLLFEDGDQFYTGNFLWGYYLAMFFVWMVTIKRLILMEKDKKYIKWIGWILLLLHCVCGTFYLYQLGFVPGVIF